MISDHNLSPIDSLEVVADFRRSPSLWAADLLLPLRLIVGWTYFSAFWRRMVIDYKLDPDVAGYVGDKFNHFLPNALLIGPVIEFFVTHPELLWWKLFAFTIVEALVGFALMAGWMTRLMGVATSGLAMGILLGAGWPGTTCLDEWQVGLLGVGSGIALVFAGGGRFSADAWMHQRWGASGRAVTGWARSLEAPLWLRQPVLLGTVGLACLGLTLWTNQVFHGGVWGTLHNKSVRPVVELSEATLRDGALNVQLYRVEGADVYGSFAIGLALRDGKGKTVVQWTAEDLAGTAEGDIHNHYVAKVRPGKYSLVLPLGARADVHLRHEALGNLAPGKYQVVLIDISGVSWHTEVTVAAWGIEGVVGW